MDEITVGGVPAAAPFRNIENQYDVNDDSIVSPLDALLVINEINTNGGRALTRVTNSAASPPAPAYYVDVNGDNLVSPLDALLVINQIGNPVAAGQVAAPLSGRAEVGATETNYETDAVGATIPAGSMDFTSPSRQTNDWITSQTTPSLSPIHNELAIRFEPTTIESSRIVKRASTSDAPIDDLEEILADVATDIMKAWQGT